MTRNEISILPTDSKEALDCIKITQASNGNAVAFSTTFERELFTIKTNADGSFTLGASSGLELSLNSGNEFSFKLKA